MALSGSFDFTVTRDDIIAAALRKIVVLAEGATPTTNQVTAASQALNVMLKSWHSHGLPLWYLQTSYIYPIHGTNTVLLGGSGGGNFTAELGLTKLTTDEIATSTSLGVSITAADDVQGTSANSDFVGIELDDGTMFWTTISAGGGTATLTIASGLTSAASTGNRVYFYTAKQNKPIEVLDLYRVHAESGVRVMLERKARKDFSALPLLSTGTPTTWTHIDTVTASPVSTDTGNLQFWPRFDSGDYYFELRIQHPFDDMDAAGNHLAFPQSWYEAVIYGLAVRLAPEYGLAIQERMALKAEADAMLRKAEEATVEKDSIFIQPVTR